MNKHRPDRLKNILKFDVGADGFERMIRVLAVAAVLLLLIGGIFIILFFKEMSVLS